MGIKGLFQFLKRFETDVFVSDVVHGQSIGIDLFWFLHRSKGDLSALQMHLQPILLSAKEIHVVIDGTPSLVRKQLLQEKSEKTNELVYTLRRLEECLTISLETAIYDGIQLKIQQIRRQLWKPSPFYIQDAVELLRREKGVTIHWAEDEADDLLIRLENQGTIRIIVTNDSDLLTLGSKNVLRLYSPVKGGLYSIPVLLQQIGWSDTQWNNFMYTCRQTNQVDLSLAYSLISVYKELDEVLEKYDQRIET
uniref:XPG-I domain-containing protein n=1 Tax=viral metagenome TaxID=1070528 RepID=A0A6C0KRX1_9ZZZZ